jgi:hypothetical protein
MSEPQAERKPKKSTKLVVKELGAKAEDVKGGGYTGWTPTQSTGSGRGR